MYRSAQSAKRCRQIENFELNFSVNGVPTTPTFDGIDKNQVLSVQDLGTGSYKINLKEKSPQNVIVIGIVSLTAGAIFSVTATDQSSVTIACEDITGAPMDASFNLCLNWLGSKHTF